MHKSYRVMIESAMCAAENFAQVKNRTNLFIIAKFICTDCKIQMCIFS